jgi:hypothetical protein
VPFVFYFSEARKGPAFFHEIERGSIEIDESFGTSLAFPPHLVIHLPEMSREIRVGREESADTLVC